MQSTNNDPRTSVFAIYDSACEPGHESLLRAVLGAVPGNSAVAMLADPVGGPVGEVYGLPQTVMESYGSRYWKMDPWAETSGWTWPGEQMLVGSDTVPPARLMDTQYYDEFAGPIRVVRLVTGMFALGPSTHAAVSVHRGLRDPDFGGDECDVFRSLLPHLRRSLQLHRRLNGSLGAEGGFAALDALAFGAVVCDAHGKVLFANRAAEELAAAGAGVVLGGSDTGLRCLSSDDTRELRRAVASAAAGEAGGALAVAGRSGEKVYVLVAPLPRRLGDRRGLVLVALRPASARSALSEADAMRLFDLTRAEARLAVGLVRGATLAALADRFGVSLNTVKTQLAHVGLKTGAASQRDLVRLLSLIPPLR
jgi:DNA-binding CsgD family transcriptional regulator